MAGSVNKVILVGNLGKDPEIRTMQDGREVANMTLATSETWKSKDTGERQEKTEWHRIVVYSEGLVNVIKNYLKKGAKVYIEGSLQTRKWQDASGQEKYTTEVVLQGFNSSLTMLDSRANSAPSSDNTSSYRPAPAAGAYAPSPAAGNNAYAKKEPVAAADVIDDEVPF